MFSQQSYCDVSFDPCYDANVRFKIKLDMDFEAPTDVLTI